MLCHCIIFISNPYFSWRGSSSTTSPNTSHSQPWPIKRASSPTISTTPTTTLYPPPWPDKCTSHPITPPLSTTTTSHLHPWLNKCTSSLPMLASSFHPHYQHDCHVLHPHPLPWPNWFPHQHMVCSLALSVLLTHLPPNPITFPGPQRWMDHKMAQNESQIIFLDRYYSIFILYTYFQTSLIHHLIFRYCSLVYPLYYHTILSLSIYHHTL